MPFIYMFWFGFCCCVLSFNSNALLFVSLIIKAYVFILEMLKNIQEALKVNISHHPEIFQIMFSCTFFQPQWVHVGVTTNRMGLVENKDEVA
jgi:energy-converting hydrogenase A subunit M